MTLSLPCTLKGRKGRYQVLSKLTEGGMSTIYVGKSSRGQPGVVKEARGTDLEQSKERLRIETDILRSLSSPRHPPAVRYVDQPTTLGHLCPVEPRLRSRTLTHRH